jgi:hypothetical protein
VRRPAQRDPAELLNHGLGNNPVARRSDHGTGDAFDLSVTLPDGTSIDDLAAAAGCSGRRAAAAAAGAPTGLDTGSASATLTVSGEGVHTVTCSATDARGNGGSTAQAIVKIDTVGPALSCSASPRTLWPPDHALVNVNATVATGDGGSGSPAFALVGASSSEPDDGTGDGTPRATSPAGRPAPDIAGQVRAERSGRVYTLTYLARDAAGNTTSCAATVTVPHNR